MIIYKKMKVIIHTTPDIYAFFIYNKRDPIFFIQYLFRNVLCGMQLAAGKRKVSTYHRVKQCAIL